MGTNTGAIGRGPRDATTHPGRHASRPAAIQPTPEAATTLTSPAPADAQHTSPEKGAVALRFRGTTFDPALAPLPPLPLPRPSDPAAELPSIAEAPRWSPVAIAGPLFVAVWICFAALAASVSSPPTADIAALGHVLATGA